MNRIQTWKRTEKKCCLLLFGEENTITKGIFMNMQAGLESTERIARRSVKNTFAQSYLNNAALSLSCY